VTGVDVGIDLRLPVGGVGFRVRKSAKPEMVAPPVIVNKNGETDSAVHLTLDASFLTMRVTSTATQERSS
jgi:hypothetical protein